MTHIIYKNNGQILTFEVRKNQLSEAATKNALHSVCLDNGITDFKNAVAVVMQNNNVVCTYTLKTR